MAPPVPVRVKEVVYTLSPFQQSVLPGLWKDLPHKIGHKLTGSVKDMALWCFLPLYGVTAYCSDYKEKEKQHHRF